MMTGAVLAGADEDEISTAEEIAGKIGLAFQIQDDILDVTGSSETLGKPIHSDEKNEKTTYVTWKGIKKAGEDVASLTEDAVHEMEGLPAGDGKPWFSFPRAHPAGVASLSAPNTALAAMARRPMGHPSRHFINKWDAVNALNHRTAPIRMGPAAIWLAGLPHALPAC